jgi:hypothetical protein
MVKKSVKQIEKEKYNKQIDDTIFLIEKYYKKSIIHDFQNPPKEFSYSASGCVSFNYEPYKYTDMIIFLNSLKK